MEVPLKEKLELSHEPAKNSWAHTKKHVSKHMFIASQFRIAKPEFKFGYPTTGEWIKKLWHICTMECY
jgi:hypothetical protein